LKRTREQKAAHAAYERKRRRGEIPPRRKGRNPNPPKRIRNKALSRKHQAAYAERKRHAMPLKPSNPLQIRDAVLKGIVSIVSRHTQENPTYIVEDTHGRRTRETWPKPAKKSAPEARGSTIVNRHDPDIITKSTIEASARFEPMLSNE